MILCKYCLYYYANHLAVSRVCGRSIVNNIYNIIDNNRYYYFRSVAVSRVLLFENNNNNNNDTVHRVRG